MNYYIKRTIYMVAILFVVTIINFILIQLPPGDVASTEIAQLEMAGNMVTVEEAAAIREQYGLDKPLIAQYFKWISNIFKGDFGYSFTWKMPVIELIGSRILLTLVVALTSILFIYGLAIPIGIYSATHQYSPGDYIVTFGGFLGLATPNFLLALILMFFFYKFFGLSVGGLFSPEFVRASWSFAKIWDMLKHMVIPVIVIGTAGTCSIIRIMRATLLDELKKQYVITARAKGMSEGKLLIKYPVRVALNPIVSTLGWAIPVTIGATNITAIVLSLQTTGPLLINALLGQDMYLAGSILLFLSTLTVIGTFVSDILLAKIDPRIRY